MLTFGVPLASFAKDGIPKILPRYLFGARALEIVALQCITGNLRVWDVFRALMNAHLFIAHQPIDDVHISGASEISGSRYQALKQTEMDLT